MRLIDADELIERIKPYDTDDFADKALYNFAFNHVICCTTVQAVPIEVLHEIRQEIEQLRKSKDYLDVQGAMIIELLTIIDKHIKEIE